MVWAIVVGPRLIRMQGHSMSPTLRDDDRALFLRVRDAPARGDIVALRYPKNPAKSFAMRVVGLPGDRRNNASDSREWGPVPRRLIWGRFHSVLLRPGS